MRRWQSSLVLLLALLEAAAFAPAHAVEPEPDAAAQPGATDPEYNWQPTLERVCVVGAGIGGSATAYFLRELLGEQVGRESAACMRGGPANCAHCSFSASPPRTRAAVGHPGV